MTPSDAVSSDAVSSVRHEHKPVGKRWPAVAAILLMACLWIAILGAMVWNSSNPVVVNRVQVLNADAIVEGSWQTGDPVQLEVSQVHKGELEPVVLELNGPYPLQIPAGPVIVPVTKIRTGAGHVKYQITQGKLPNFPSHSGSDIDRTRPLPDAYTSEVRPVVYPASKATMDQLQQIWEWKG